MSLSTMEEQTLKHLRAQTLARRTANRVANSYYDASIVLKNMNIAVPPTLTDIGVASDWPATIVDAYHERLDFDTWTSKKYGVHELATFNDASVHIAESTLDACVIGVGFIAVENDSQGATGAWRFKSVSPEDGTLMWDYGRGIPTAGYRRVGRSPLDAEGTFQEILYLPNRNIILETTNGKTEIIDVHETYCDAPAMQRIRSKQRAKRFYGASMISKPVRYYTDAAMRTLLGMEINREFYTTPQRWAMNADMSMFTASDNPTEAERIEAGWKATAGKMLALPAPDEGDPAPVVGQFSAAPPTPYIEQLRGYSQMLASATGMPSAYLGFTTENPPSAEAIRAWTERLIRSSLRQQRLINPDLNRTMYALYSAENKQRIDWSDFRTSVRPRWQNPANETLAADTDALVKLASIDAVDPTSDWAYDRLRIPEEQRAEMRATMRKKQAQTQLQEMLNNRASQVDKSVTDATKNAETEAQKIVRKQIGNL